MERTLLNPWRLIGMALALGAIAALAVACGGGGGEGPAGSTGSPGAGGNLCDLLPKDQVQAITSFTVGPVQERKGPGFLHFCTIYLDVPGCEQQCALSLEDLGKIGPNSNNDPDSFRQTLIDVNPDFKPAFQDDVVGESSWLATGTSGEASGLKILYFKVGEVAYDLTSPRVTGGVLTEDQMVALALYVIRIAR